jgi:DNA-binding LacI/PurR family transcriptional regulator
VQAAIEQLADPVGRPGPRKVIGLTHSHVTEGPEHRGLEIILEQVLGGAELMARKRGYSLYTLQNSYLLHEPAGDAFPADVQGVITAGGLVSRSLLESIRRRGLPVVIIGGQMPDLAIPSVAANNLDGMAQATRHLLELGHRRIGLVNGPTDTCTSFEKKAGYLAALMDAGIVHDPDLIRWHDGHLGFDMAVALPMVNALLDLVDPPTALLFANDAMAHAGIAACRERGLRVPEDVSIVGFHDDPDARLALPQLTTVRVDRTGWGAAAVRRLLGEIEEGLTGSDRLLLPVELVVRDSTTCVRSA